LFINYDIRKKNGRVTAHWNEFSDWYLTGNFALLEHIVANQWLIIIAEKLMPDRRLQIVFTLSCINVEVDESMIDAMFCL
jgi:hypothetical protein